MASKQKLKGDSQKEDLRRLAISNNDNENNDKSDWFDKPKVIKKTDSFCDLENELIEKQYKAKRSVEVMKIQRNFFNKILGHNCK